MASLHYAQMPSALHRQRKPYVPCKIWGLPLIKNRIHKIEQIVATIKTRISEINERYRNGPDLYFYKRLNQLRHNSNSIESFLRNDYHIEILYATLVSWDMNSRGAKMKYFDEFKESVLSCLNQFKQLENFEENVSTDSIRLMSTLRNTYEKLSLMKTGGRLVSNSKLLHFLFPKLCMPMDRMNTLSYFYGNTGESVNKYMEIIEFSYEIINMPENWDNYLDNNWNATVPKMIDNAIILLVGKSIK